MKSKLLLFLFILSAINIKSQVSFYVNDRIFESDFIRSVVPVAIADLNGDNLDDIVVLHEGKFLKSFIQNHNTGSFSIFNYGQVAVNPQNAIAVADLDDTNYKEIIIGGTYDRMKIYKSYDGINLYLKYKESSKNFFTQNIALIDFNSNGYLDILVNDDDDVPILFINDKGESFTPTDDLIDLSTGFGGDSGNYGSIWTDFDNDGDIDLYISKCRIGVNDPSDLRRVNRLFVNDGKGNFEERAAEFNLDIGEQSWVTEFADLDNDGDKDIIMLNHTNSNFLLENLGDGNYMERYLNTDFEDEFEGFQLLVRDFDNNGFKDILITGVEARMFWNMGGFSLLKDTEMFKEKQPTSSAVGDLNYDGFWDIYTSYSRSLIGSSKFFNDEILMNRGNQNHYIKVSLHDMLGQKSGVGSEVMLFGAWGIQSYEVRIGESYGISNSDDIVFGLGAFTDIDSMVVRWPSGVRTVFRPEVIDTHYLAFSSGYLTTVPTIEVEGLKDNILCNGGQFQLSVGGNYDAFLWSDGNTNARVDLERGGQYSLNLIQDGHPINVPSVLIEEFDQLHKPVITDLTSKAGYCIGENITLSTNYSSNILWTNGSTSDTVSVPANFPVSVSYNICDTLESDTFLANLFIVDPPIIFGDTIEPGEIAVLTSSDSMGLWYKNLEESDYFAIGNEIYVPGILEDTVFYSSRRDTVYKLDNCGKKTVSKPYLYAGNNINGGISFRVTQYHTLLHKVVCYSDFPGKRKILLKDFWGKILDEREVNIDTGKTIITLDFNLAPSSYYYLTTDTEFNNAEFGINSPLLHRDPSPNPGLFPLPSDSGNIIIESISNQTPYYYFYDWILVDVNIMCESELVAADVVIELDNNVKEVNRNVSIYPNPFNNGISVDLPSSGVTLRVFSQDGSELIRRKVDGYNEYINLSGYPGGVYYIQFLSDNFSHVERIIKF